MSTTFTPQRSLARPSMGRTVTASSPNLSASYSVLQASAANSYRTNALPRKNSCSSLTSGSLAAIPDASKGYGLNPAVDDTFRSRSNMASITPLRAGGGEGDGLDIGDTVDVPGNMYGTVLFIGNVQGKRGMFAGVELSHEFSTRGKNSGDVDGVSYFQTLIPGAGIFLPLNRATKRESTPSRDGSFPLTPSTPSAGGSFNVGGHGSNAYTPPTPSLPKFSQSVGPNRVPSPAFKKSRPSLPRPESPLRRPQTASRSSTSTPAPNGPPRYASPAPGKFGQSVRGTKDSGDPSKRLGYTPRNGFKSSMGPGGPRSTSALGQLPMNYSDDETTPIGVTRANYNPSFGSVSSFNAKMRPASRTASRATSRANDEEADRLRSQLEERDNQLKEQASSLAEMESALAEVQTLMGAAEAPPSRPHRGSIEDKDVPQLRAIVREKNDRIAMLTAEFDAHRADFRSTIDTLELASTETERVYEKRVDDLLQELREMQDRTEDVDSVARQLKQLEELVQELEEGLEDARRGEAEARGEVEFLRGEVERTRSELRREREKAATALKEESSNRDSEALAKDIAQRDDEIRGLKAIIHSLSRDAIPDTLSSSPDLQKTPTQRQDSFSKIQPGSNGSDVTSEKMAREKLERELKDLKAILEGKANREDELERELEQMRRGSASTSASQRVSAMTSGSSGTITRDSSLRDSKGTIGSWRDRDIHRDMRSPESHRRGNTLDTMPESDTYSSTNESFCELCETSGHDILTCTNMFTTNGQGHPPVAASYQRTGRDVVKEGLKLSPQPAHDDYHTPAPLSPMKKPLPPPPAPVRIIPNPMESGPVAGKESGVVNMDKWCGVCEREGHESIDCPFEDAF